VTFFVTTLWARMPSRAPHKQISWRLSKDPLFVEKVRDLESVTHYCRRINDRRR
jgi:hypothetical protein